MPSREIAIIPIVAAPAVMTPKRIVSISIETLITGTLIGFVLGVISCYAFFEGAVSRALAHNQISKFLIMQSPLTVEVVDDNKGSRQVLIDFARTTKIVAVDVGAKLPMYTAQMRQVSRESSDGKQMLCAVDEVLLLGRIESETIDRGCRDIPTPEYLGAEEQFLQASTADVAL